METNLGKEIYDIIHGHITISPLANRIIDTPAFQRLRYLRQLGTCFYVFPSATHTRFEHSLGTYHLTEKVLKIILENYDKNSINSSLSEIEELKSYYSNKIIINNNEEYNNKLDNHICELIKIAGLCHDLGHGPFSHVFDDHYILQVKDNYKECNYNQNYNYHEYRSCMIIEDIIKNDEFLKNNISTNEIKFIQKLIKPTPSCKSFVFQIVSNNLNSIDVDKFDYIARDSTTLGLKYGIDFNRIINGIRIIDNKICYPEKIYYEIASLFTTRYRLHKEIYTHKAVVSTQYMIIEILLLIDPILKLYESIFDVKKFIILTDEYIISMLKMLYLTKDNYNTENKQKIENAYDIWNKLNYRKLYKLVGNLVSDKKIELELFANLKEIKIYSGKIGFISANKNPLKNVFLYNKKNATICKNINSKDISYLIPTKFQEYIYLFFSKNTLDEETNKKFKELLDKLNE